VLWQVAHVRVAMFSTKPYDQTTFQTALGGREGEVHDVDFLEDRLHARTVALARGADAVCIFVNDTADAAVLRALAEAGVRHVALRCAGFNNVDLGTAAALGLNVVRVPAYSPNAVAEHTIALVLALNRRIHKAYNRVREGNFALDGLVGFDLAGKTAGVIGTGRIGALVARLLWHFRCEVLAYDVHHDPKLEELGVTYVGMDEIWRRSDLVSLNCPLTPETHHLVSAEVIGRMKPGVLLVNTGRGALIDTRAAIDGLKAGRIGALALDVYEEEAPLFFEDRSSEVLADDVFARLLTFPNVLITAHQAFLTQEALGAIAATTLANLDDLAAGRPCPNRVELPHP
jgi:D-lactate dehydrogenase